jgi:SAM-dependent methyltransferase
MAHSTGSVRVAYDRMAPHYDRFTAHHDYDAWTRTLERLARDNGLRGRRLLDVGCGTGKSFLPFLRRGYDVVGCDVSPAMVERARAKAPGVPLHVCDVRALPTLGRFDLVCCLDDCLNHLLDRAALALALRRIAANLAPGGVLVFDLNTLATYRSFFAAEHTVGPLRWHGRTPPDLPPGGLAGAELRAPGSTVTHVQRHHPEPEVRAALTAAGLRRLAVYGQGLDGIPQSGADELVHTKAVYVVRRGERR